MLNPEQHPRYEEQIQLELEMSHIGAERFRSRIDTAHEGGRGGDTQVSRQYIRGGIEPLSKAISDYVADAYSGRPGPRPVAAQRLKDMDPKAVAYITIRTLLTAHLSQRRPPYLLRLAAGLGKCVEYEERFTIFSEQAPGLYSKVYGGAKNGSEDHTAKVLTYAMNKFDIEWNSWTQSERLQVGMSLIDLTASSTGLIEIVMGVDSGYAAASATQYVVRMTSTAEEWFANSIEAHERLSPFRMPTIIPPKKWHSISGGGYHSPEGFMHHQRLVRDMRKDHSKELGKAHLGVVYSALNAVQETTWKVNGDILDVVTHLLEQNSAIAGLPPRDDIPLPPKPFDIDTNEEALQTWKWAARDVHFRNTRLRQERLSVRSVVSSAARFRGEDEIYYPHNLDFRGRMYPLPFGAQPQGSDLEKALIHFSKGEPLGEDGAYWLAVHGANCFGVDKVSFEDREAWVKENQQLIVDVANDPYNNLWWTEADKPWCFLAFCFEWASYVRSPDTFLNHIPIALDGSCNGLQHFSAMLLDPVGGSAVNLVPSDKPQDIYQRVADEALFKLKAISKNEEAPEEQKRWAYSWINFGLDRKVTKRPVMVLPYGGTPRSCLKYVEEAIMDKINSGKDHNLGEELPSAIAFLSKVIWESIGDVVIAARAAMSWLQKVARVLSKHELPIVWTTPSGFVAYQAYPNLKKRKIKTKIAGSIIQSIYYSETDRLDKSKQANSISPNFVHSMDASAMVMTIDRLNAEGIQDFAMVHDSYGVHARHATQLSTTLRQVFVEMYQSDPLRHFRDEIAARYPEVVDELPPLPKKGDLDLTQVMLSEYFFA